MALKDSQGAAVGRPLPLSCRPLIALIPENRALGPARPGRWTWFLRPAGCPPFPLVLQTTLFLVEMGGTASGRAFPLRVRVWGGRAWVSGDAFVWVDPVLGGSRRECLGTAGHVWEGFLGPGLPF